MHLVDSHVVNRERERKRERRKGGMEEDIYIHCMYACPSHEKFVEGHPAIMCYLRRDR